MADGKPQAALQQFEKAAALDPDNAAIKARAAVAEISSGQVGPGLAKLEEVFWAKRAHPSPARPWYWRSCGPGASTKRQKSRNY